MFLFQWFLIVFFIVLYFIYLAYLAITKNKKKFFEWLDIGLVVAIEAFLVINFIARTYFIPSGSMIPTLKISDRVIGNKFIYTFRKPQRQDVIIFKPPFPTNDRYVKRLIGMPGDTLEIKNGQVYIQEAGQSDYYMLDESRYPVRKDNFDYGPILIPDKHYFMLGDNRGNSNDSRFWGFVPEENIEAQAAFIFWPIKNLGIIPQ